MMNSMLSTLLVTTILTQAALCAGETTLFTRSRIGYSLVGFGIVLLVVVLIWFFTVASKADKLATKGEVEVEEKAKEELESIEVSVHTDDEDD